ncbi:MAG: DUF1934 domain-containing protein [Clostridia bacterium]|nr:DUF1934 domain-containing protein [Clostridia bacterium]
MKRDVTLTLKSEQIYSDSRDKNISTAHGTLELTDDNICLIRYTEPDSEMAGCVSLVKVDSPDKIHLIRDGTYKADFIIEKGKTHKTLYRTPYIQAELEITGKKVFFGMNEKGCCVMLQYIITSNGEPLNENKLTINAKY